jgi:hypothetical protein
MPVVPANRRFEGSHLEVFFYINGEKVRGQRYLESGMEQRAFAPGFALQVPAKGAGAAVGGVVLSRCGTTRKPHHPDIG